MKIRSFISLDLPLSLRHELSGHAKLIAGQDKRQKIRWLPPENYHLTLVFLGDLESVKISALQLTLEQKLESTKALTPTISAIFYITLNLLAKRIKTQPDMLHADIPAESVLVHITWYGREVSTVWNNFVN